MPRTNTGTSSTRAPHYVCTRCGHEFWLKRKLYDEPPDSLLCRHCLVGWADLQREDGDGRR